MISLEELKNTLRYEPDTGKWVWLIQSRPQTPVGSVAGTISHHGYRIITIAGKKYRSSRLAWLYMTGKWPDAEIDHEDRDRKNDKWNNLREANSTQNHHNTIMKPNNTSGHKGVFWWEERCKWIAKIRIGDGKRLHLGCFDKIEDAIKAYEDASRLYHGNFGRVA